MEFLAIQIHSINNLTEKKINLDQYITHFHTVHQLSVLAVLGFYTQLANTCIMLYFVETVTLARSYTFILIAVQCMHI